MAGATVRADLPPPPSGPDELGQAQLYLELVVNRRPSGQVVPVLFREGHYYVTARDLRQVSLPVEGGDGRQVEIDTMSRVKTEYDSAGQRLLLTVPGEWLPLQYIGRDHVYARQEAQSSLGALLNYELYVADPDHGYRYGSAWTEARLFGRFGSFSNSGVYQHYFAAGSPQGDRYIRYDTGWLYADEQRMRTYELGDLVTHALPWSSSVRLGGAQIARDFSVRPDVITYPLPQFRGEAAVPTTVDLLINGYRASRDQVEPGPFTLTDVPFINGAGEAVVVTTDALGRQVSTRVPFYVTSKLLRQGLSDYSLAVGSLRRGYGIENFSYGPGAASGAYRYGLSDYLTLESHFEGASGFALGGLGSVLRLGTLGTLSSAFSQSRLDGRQGGQVSLAYQYNSRHLGLSLQRIERSAGYADLAVYDSRHFSLSRRSTQAIASLALEHHGTLGAGYFDVEAWDGSRTRLLNLSWSKPLWRNSSLYLSANREIGGAGWAMAAQLVIPFELMGSLSVTWQRDQHGLDSQRVNYSRATPSRGGFGWNLGYSTGEQRDAYRQLGLSWRNRAVQLQGGLYGSSADYTRWADASGSLVWMDSDLFAANRVGDSFVLVSTDGQPDIPVRYENQLMGSTDAHGHLLVPWSSSYYPGKYEIDPLGLPAYLETPTVEQRVAVRARSGYRVRFPVRRIVAASIVLVDADGRPLPLGVQVSTDQGRQGYVGWDGIVYLEGLGKENEITASLPDGRSCTARFSLDTQAERVAQIGPLTCR